MIMRLLQIHLNNLIEASSKDLTTPSMLFALTCGVLPRAQLAISKSSIIKNKPIKEILNNKGLRIEPYGVPKIKTCQLL